jgi:hypothetical protein
VGQEERERAVDQLKAAQRTLPGEVEDADDLRVVAVHERLDRDAAGPLRCRDDPVDING